MTKRASSSPRTKEKGGSTARLREEPPPYVTAGRPSALVDTRVVYCGDNLEQLQKLPDACVDLIYIDPPFNSNRNYEVFWGETKEKRAFEDRHANTQAYLDYMRPRCVELARVLKRTGSFYYHCDWHASHYVKVMLDQILGENNFINEIVWKRSDAKSDVGQGAKHFGRVHDSIFYYAGSAEYTFNPKFTPLPQSTIDSWYKHVEEGTGRRYNKADVTGPGGAAKGCPVYEWHGITRAWRYSRENMERLEREGRLVYSKTGMAYQKRYLDESKGVALSSWWDDIDMLRGISGAGERLGYPTQKPLKLLERIIEVSSHENDIVLDAFCGCGTALVAAQKLKRQWIGIDISPTACRVMAKRLRDVCGVPEDESLWKAGRGFVVRDLPWTEDKLRAIPPFEFENWAVIALGGIPNKTKVGDYGIDGRIFPVGAEPAALREGELQLTERWYPIQVKQKDRVGRPDIDAFQTAMRRSKRDKGFFVAFDYTEDALREIDRFFKADHAVIVPLTVQEILDEQIARKLA
ncbi:MAG: restriction endonuclease [Verrucomicrobia bacterium]|jgi:DNA modification methylase|nr:restriction endonuclease [Verrucomicrobiota bacterium]